MKKYLIAIIIFCMTLSSVGICYASVSLNINSDGTQSTLAGSSEQTSLFPDTQTSDWYYPHMKMLVEKGGINGYADNTFKPNNTITNAEFVKIIIGIIDGEKSSGTEHWAENYLNTAIQLGIVLTDEYTVEQYDQPMKRQNMAKVVSRTADKVLHETIVEDTEQYTNRIADWNDTCSVCKPDIAQVYAKGIIAGMPDGSFAGNLFATRAEATTMIVRLIDSSYRVTVYGKVSFNEKTDIMVDGRMTAAKTKNFIDITLENLKFYKENNKYYVTCTFPELPKGFENWLMITSQSKRNEPSFGFTTGFTMIEDNKIPNTGSFTKELNISNDDLDFIVIRIGIDATEKTTDESLSAYYNINTSHQNEVSFVKADGTVNEYIEYDFSRIFQW